MSRPENKQTSRGALSGDELAALILRGDARAAGQVLTWIEDGEQRAKEILKLLYPRTGRAHVVGLTGAMGSGKSSLIERITAELRNAKKEIGVLTVDPSSPFSGGALLGDRVRMRSHFLDQGVFIRSLATRGHQGGLSNYIYQAVHLLDAMGKDYILIETIGTGQDQIEIAGAAHTVVVVVTPEGGDEIQALKAGLFEIGDLLVVNKMDRSGAEEMVMKLRDMLGASGVRIFQTSANQNVGIKDLIAGIEAHRAQLLASGDHKKRMQNLCRQQLMALIKDNLLTRVLKKVDGELIEQLAEEMRERQIDPYTAAESVVNKLGV